MRGRILISLAIGVFVSLSTRAALAAVEIEAETTCLDQEQLSSRLQQILVTHADSHEVDLLITVADEEKEVETKVVLQAITGEGDLVLDRQFNLSPADCESSADLLATVLSRFVQELPLARWTLKQERKPTPPSPPEPEKFSMAASGRLGAFMELAPVGGSAEVVVATDIGKSEHALGIEISVVASYPSDLGPGQFYTVLLQGGAGWKYSPDPWLTRISVRAGALMAAGSGFAANHEEWLPWTELTGAVGRKLGPVILLGSLAVSPFRHTAVTADKQLSKAIPSFRLGLALEIPIWRTEF